MPRANALAMTWKLWLVLLFYMGGRMGRFSMPAASEGTARRPFPTDPDDDFETVGDGVLDVPPPQRGGLPDAAGIGGRFLNRPYTFS